MYFAIAHRPNNDQSIYDVFAGIRVYRCVTVFVSMERDLIFGYWLYVFQDRPYTIAIQTNPFTMYSLVFVHIDVYSLVWNGPDLYLDTDCMFFSTDLIQ